MKRYRQQRRLIGPVYRPDSVIKLEPAIDAVLDRTIAKLKRMDGAELNLKRWMHMLVVECLGAAVLSWSPGMLKQETDWYTSEHAYLGWRRKSVFGLFPLMAKMQYISRPVNRWFSNLWGVTHEPPAGFRPFFPVRI